jgi:hypothetical protein
MAADPGVAVGGAPAGSGNVVAPNGLSFKLSSPLGPGQSLELPGRVRVDAASGPGRVRLGASASGHYGDGPQAVATTGDVAVDGLLVGVAAPAPPGGPTTKNPVGGKAPATAGTPSPAGSGGRKPVRASAGVSGAAGSAASAAPVTPAPTSPEPTPTPAPPVAAPATPPPAPAAAPSATQAGEQTAAPKPRPKAKGTSPDRGRWAWGGAAAVLLTAVAAAGVTRLTGGVRR